MPRVQSIVAAGIVAVGFAVIVAAAFAFRSVSLPESVVESLSQQLDAERRADSEKWIAGHRKTAAMIDEFTGGAPVKVLRLEDGGAIVENVRGEEWFVANGEESPAPGEHRWLTLVEEGAAIGGLADHAGANL